MVVQKANLEQNHASAHKQWHNFLKLNFAVLGLCVRYIHRMYSVGRMGGGA